MKNKIIKYFPYIFIFLLIIFYFQYSVTITWDSTHYMNYVNIFEGKVGWNTWDVVRGPVFPLIIHIGNIIFGKTSQGLIMMTFIFYLIMLYFNYKIIKNFLDNLNIKNKTKKIISYTLILSIIINPIIYGFYHCLLTEFVAITLSSISCYLAPKWLNSDFYIQRKTYIGYSLLFIFLTIISWFLKQPYVSAGLFVLLVTYFISIFEHRNKKNFAIRTITLFICVLSLFLSIKAWNYVLRKMGNDPSTDRNPTNSLGVQLINAVGYMEVVDDYEIYTKEYINNSKLTKKEKNRAIKMIKSNDDYIIINYKNKNNKISKSKLIVRGKDEISTLYALKYLGNEFINNPLKLSEAYLDNYLATIDFYSTKTEDGVGYSVSKNVKIDFSSEIGAIAYKPYKYNQSNVFYVLPEMYERVEQYEQKNLASPFLNFLMMQLGFICLIIFKILFLILPLTFIISIIVRFKNKCENKYNLNISIILLGYSLLHVILHAFTGAILDRYIVPVFLQTFLGTIFLVYNVFYKKKIK